MANPSFKLKDLKRFVGQTGLYIFRHRQPESQSGDPELRFPVKILDAKGTFGLIRFLISPVGGKGRQWVKQERIELNHKK